MGRLTRGKATKSQVRPGKTVSASSQLSRSSKRKHISKAHDDEARSELDTALHTMRSQPQDTKGLLHSLLLPRLRSKQRHTQLSKALEDFQNLST